MDTSYSILKYRRDASEGEVMNIGVVLYSPETGQLGVQISPRVNRLGAAFPGFDSDLYDRVTGELVTALSQLGAPLGGGLFQVEGRERFADAAAIVREAWPDEGLCYFAGPARFMLIPDFEAELDDLYDRFVQRQQDGRDPWIRADDYHKPCEIPLDDIDDEAWGLAMQDLAAKEGRTILPLPFSDD